MSSGEISPLSPVLSQVALELGVLGLEARLRGDHSPQGLFEVALDDVSGDEALAVPDASEALAVEVVGDSDAPDLLSGLDQIHGFAPAQMPQCDLEAIALTVRFLDRPAGSAEVFEANLVGLVPDRLARDRDELLCDPLPILEAGVGEGIGPEVTCAGQLTDRFGRGELLLPQHVEVVWSGSGLGDRGLGSLDDPKVFGGLLDLQDTSLPGE